MRSVEVKCSKALKCMGREVEELVNDTQRKRNVFDEEGKIQ